MARCDNSSVRFCRRLQRDRAVFRRLGRFFFVMEFVSCIASTHLDQEVVRDAVGRGDVDVEQGRSVALGVGEASLGIVTWSSCG